jgi:hypothetical protein
MRLGEVFGTRPSDLSPVARKIRKSKYCPFRGSACTKSRKRDPLGVCSLADGDELTITCPVRFQHDRKIFIDCAEVAFGEGTDFAILPEYKLLEVCRDDAKVKKIGKIDFLVGRITNGQVTDFCALEVQSVYTSGGGVEDAFKRYLKDDKSELGNELGVDYRSSAQKRLFPQLALKVPVFRRWGKKFFVAIDRQFFEFLPSFPTVSEGNSEITWLPYDFRYSGNDVEMTLCSKHYSEWDAVSNALREGKPPEHPNEVIGYFNVAIERGAATIIKP